MRVHLFISGRVQGVFFRHCTRSKASELGLNGWVRNLPDGRVEAVFEGPAREIETMVVWCHKGPATAQVEKVTLKKEKPEGLQSFETRY